jgi:hypothetical protein
MALVPASSLRQRMSVVVARAPGRIETQKVWELVFSQARCFCSFLEYGQALAYNFRITTS